MKKLLKTSLLYLLLFFLCITFSNCVYSDVTMPLDNDVNNTDLGSKIGKSSARSLFWLVAWGDAGVNAAAQNGDIKIVKHLDVEEYTILFGLYTKVTTVAYGD